MSHSLEMDGMHLKKHFFVFCLILLRVKLVCSLRVFVRNMISVLFIFGSNATRQGVFSPVQKMRVSSIF
jgi:hypothetical protein